MGQEHRPERRMGSYTATSQQFGSEYLAGGDSDHNSYTWQAKDYPQRGSNEGPSPKDGKEPDFARLPKKPKPTRPSSAAREK